MRQVRGLPKPKYVACGHTDDMVEWYYVGFSFSKLLL